MQYLMIENPGVAPLEGFTVLGLSSSRGQSESIGQFGSGNKHAILVLLRMGLVPTIYLGKKKLTFTTEPATMGDTSYNKVLYSLGGSAKKDMGACLAYGELDWDKVDMALREFVSNALDATNQDFGSINVSLKDSPRAKSGTTRVFIPATPDVVKFMMSLKDKFLHASGQQGQTLMEKSEPNRAKVYRKGVFVRELRRISLFDYNFGEELKIDEARNLDDYSVASSACKKVSSSSEGIATMFQSLVRNRSKDDIWEHGFSKWNLDLDGRRNKKLWVDTWKDLYGNGILGMESQSTLVERCIKKGQKVILIGEDAWYNAMSKAGIPTVISLSDDINDKGYEVVSASQNILETLDFCWTAMELTGMTKGKSKPEVRMFRQIVDGEEIVCGYVDRDKVVHINVDNETSKNTMFEELSHYVSGAADMTRDFQSFVIEMATRFAEAMV
jgi:hypothetical protein